jgi:glycerophosphoryl diester phosphodiesterase
LVEIKAFATGIGPDKNLLERDATIAARAHAAGLVVHPYTVRRDQKPGKYPTTQDELRRILFEHDVDGLFCDFPDDGVAVLAAGR